MIAYYKGAPSKRGHFPALDTPCCAFARYGGFAHNGNHTPNAQQLPRSRRTKGAIQMFGYPGPRWNA